MTVVVIDANLWISTVVPLEYSPRALSKLKDWERGQARIVVPTLWHYEVISSLRKAVALEALLPDNLEPALSELEWMAFEEIPPSLDLDRLALAWAERLGQIVAYDAQYLALAEHLGGEFWTADKRLTNSAQQNGVAWVHWVGER